MVERIEDLNLPNAVVARLIKDALPDGANVSKEARLAIGKAASVFVIYLTSTSTTLAHKQHHKTITAANIIESLKELEFENFVAPLERDMETYRKLMKDKKDSKAKRDAATTESTASSAVNGNTEEIMESSEEVAATAATAAVAGP